MNRQTHTGTSTCVMIIKMRGLHPHSWRVKHFIRCVENYFHIEDFHKNEDLMLILIKLLLSTKHHRKLGVKEKVSHNEVSSFVRAAAHVCHPLPPSCWSSIKAWLRLWDDGWRQKHTLSVLHFMSLTHSPWWPSIGHRSHSDLSPITWRRLRLQEKEKLERGSKQRIKNVKEQRKTSCSRWHQMYLRGSSRGSSERAQHERLQTGSERQAGRMSARRGWANAQGRKRESPLPPLDSTWFMWQL